MRFPAGPPRQYLAGPRRVGFAIRNEIRQIASGMNVTWCVWQDGRTRTSWDSMGELRPLCHTPGNVNDLSLAGG